MESGKFHQQINDHDNQVPSKSTREVRAISVESESSSSESVISRSKDGAERRSNFATTAPNPVKSDQYHRMSHGEADRVELSDHGEQKKACTHCGSIKHNDWGCQKRLTC